MDGLEEIAVADDDVLQASAVDVSALGRQLQECRIDDQLLVAIRLRAARSFEILPRLGLELAIAIDGDVSDGPRESKDSVDQQKLSFILRVLVVKFSFRFVIRYRNTWSFRVFSIQTL